MKEETTSNIYFCMAQGRTHRRISTLCEAMLEFVEGIVFLLRL